MSCQRHSERVLIRDDAQPLMFRRDSSGRCCPPMNRAVYVWQAFRGRRFDDSDYMLTGLYLESDIDRSRGHYNPVAASVYASPLYSSVIHQDLTFQC